MNKTPKHATEIRAFTLLEMLLAVTVLCILLTLLLGIVSQILKIGQGTWAESERLERAGAVFDMMRRDISTAMPPLSGADTQSLQFLLNPASSISQKNFQPSAAFWQSSLASRTGNSDLAVLGYLVRWTDDTVPKAQLCRVEISPLDSSGGINTRYRIGSDQPWIDNDLIAQTIPATPPDYEGLVAEDIIALWIRAIDSEGRSFYTWDSRTKNNELPRAVEVALVVLDSRAAARLTEVPAASAVDAENFNDEIQAFIESLPPPVRQGARVFRTTFPLYNRPAHP